MSDIAKWNGIAIAGIAKWNGIAVAGISKYNGITWPAAGGDFVAASGGNFTYTDGDYKIHKFTGNGASGSVVLLHFNGDDSSTTFTDESGTTWTRAGNAHIHQGEKKFGNASGYFDGTGDYITAGASTDFDLGQDTTSSFTIDFWFNTTTAVANAMFYSDLYEQPSSGRGWSFRINSAANDGKLYWSTGIGDSSIYMDLITSTGGYNDGNWHHAAGVRQGTSFKIYVDGVEKASTTFAYNPYPGSGSYRSIARCMYYGGGGTYDYAGYIDEFRLSKNVARWTADFSGSLPSAEYTSDYVSGDTFTVTTGGDIEVLVVAGGGAGGTWCGGGGGAGGFLYEAAHTVTAKAYSVTVGAGAPHPSANGPGANGSNSVFDSGGSIMTAIGGGGGGSYDTYDGKDGGSGGGAAYTGTHVGIGTAGPPRQGYNGGIVGVGYLGGGGGGAAEAGNTDGDGYGGDGNATYSDLLIAASAGVDIGGVHYIAGGGGGWVNAGNASIKPGGDGGGGAGGSSLDSGGNLEGVAGTPNTGGGGGGGHYHDYNLHGGAGGSGIVIIKYRFQQEEIMLDPKEEAR